MNLPQYGRKITAALLLNQSLYSASTIMAFTVGSIIVLELTGQNARWSGVPSTLNLVGAAIMAYPMGRLMDRIGRRLGLSMGYIYGIVGALVAAMGVVQANLLIFLLGVLGMGFAKGVIDQARYAAADANPPTRRGRALSLVVLGGTVGSIVGPTLIKLTGNVAQSVGLPAFSGPWFTAAFFLSIAFVIVNIFLRPDPLTVAKQFDSPIESDKLTSKNLRSWGEILGVPAIRLGMGTMIIGQLVMVMIMAITPVHMHLHHHDIGAISVVIMAHTMGMFGFSFATGWLVDRLGSPRMIVAGSLVLISAALIAPVSNKVPGLALGLFLLGLGWNFCYVAGSALLAAHLIPGEKGKVQGVTDTMVSLASAVGSFSSGFVFAALGFSAMNWLAIGVAVIPLLLVMLFGRTQIVRQYV